jgi:hypothetical protein
VTRARRSSLTAAIVGSDKPIALKDYGARQTRAGVTVKVSEARKLVSHLGNRGFIAKKLGGHVFTRDTKERFPISKRYGPSISSAVNDAVADALERVGNEALRKRFAEEVRFERIKMDRAK